MGIERRLQTGGLFHDLLIRGELDEITRIYGARPAQPEAGSLDPEHVVTGQFWKHGTTPVLRYDEGEAVSRFPRSSPYGGSDWSGSFRALPFSILEV